MKGNYDGRNCILERGGSEEVKRALELRLTKWQIGFLIVPAGDDKWNVFREDHRKPRYNMSCVDKVDGMLKRIQMQMLENPGKTLYVRIEGEIGIRGLNYHLEID